eukprot:TRINITY_DN10369_c0_g1_i1.p1 TRINITY_DN10369_c0_g1~~TRINITY_DN10369_c0_g1_i1.p1  ORF type:complete len:416 (+),score=107.98 TRINITY_DN10369_c0_g1_i1:336-1583(+)
MDFTSLLDGSSGPLPNWAGPTGRKAVDGVVSQLERAQRLRTNYGLFQGEALERAFDRLVQAKTGTANTTFSQLRQLTGRELRVTGTCVTTGRLEWFDADSAPDMPVSKAIRISSGIPFFFEPVHWNGKLYVDGGCLRNLPIEAFPSDSVTRTLAFGFTEPANTAVQSFVSFAAQLIETMMYGPDSGNYEGVRDGVRADMIRVDPGNVSAVSFGLPPEVKKELIVKGWQSAAKVLREVNCQPEVPLEAPDWLVELASAGQPPARDLRQELAAQPAQAATELREVLDMAWQCAVEHHSCKLQVDPYGTDDRPGLHVKRLCDPDEPGCQDHTVHAGALSFTASAFASTVLLLVVGVLLFQCAKAAGEEVRYRNARGQLKAAMSALSKKPGAADEVMAALRGLPDQAAAKAAARSFADS